jgi:hypothetical protein
VTLDQFPKAAAALKSLHVVVELVVSAAGADAVEVARDRADVFRDRPFVIVEHNDEAFGLRLHIIERFVADPAGESGVACDNDNVLIAPAQIATDRHSQSGRERCAGVSGAVAIVLAFRAEQKAVQALILPHCADTIEPAGKHFVHVTLMAHVHDKSVVRRIENAMERDRQFDHAEVRSEVAAGLRKHFDELVAHFLGELWQILFRQRFHVGGRTNSIKQTRSACRFAG